MRFCEVLFLNFFLLFVRCSPVCCAVLPVSVDTSNEVMYAKKQTEKMFKLFKEDSEESTCDRR